MELKTIRRRGLKLIAAFAAATTVLLLLVRLLPQSAGELLVRNDVEASLAPSPGDSAGRAPSKTYVMTLMGDVSSSRADKALAVYNAQPGRTLVFAHVAPTSFQSLGLAPEEADIYAEYFRRHGIPQSAMVLLKTCDATSTIDEARCLRDYLVAQEQPMRVIVVTTWYHSSRAGWMFEHVFAGTHIPISVAAAFGGDSSPADWWRHEPSFISVFNEYLKWTYWLLELKTGLAPKRTQ